MYIKKFSTNIMIRSINFFVNRCEKIIKRHSWSSINNHFEKYRTTLAKKISYILKYDETDVNSLYENQWECVLPGFKKYLESGYYRYMFGRYLYSIKYVKNKHVLDSGCGLGWGSYLISDYPQDILSIDNNEKALVFAREKWKDSKLNFKNHSVLDLISLNKKFDVILGFELIEHLTFVDGKKYLEQVFNTLNRKGLLILSSLFPDSKEEAKALEEQNNYHLKIFTKNELKIIAKEIGFKKIWFIENFMGVIRK